MEIPSSSPAYTPLGSGIRVSHAEYELPHVNLFPATSNPPSPQRKEPPPRDEESPPRNEESRADLYGNYDNYSHDEHNHEIHDSHDSHDGHNSLGNHDSHDNETPPSQVCTTSPPILNSDDTAIETDTEVSNVDANDSIGDGMDSSDNETTILSDDELTQSMPAKNTQNYLEEFLTESLLESLPLPPERKLGLQGKYGHAPTSNWHA